VCKLPGRQARNGACKDLHISTQVGELVAIQEEYEQAYLDSDITFTDNTPYIEVNKESFEILYKNLNKIDFPFLYFAIASAIEAE
jgi:hypothetical protein